MEDSILLTVRNLIGGEEFGEAFDQDLILHINTILDILVHQFGIGPTSGFCINGPEETWSQFIGTSDKYNAVKSYVVLRVRLIFDPPTSSFVLNAMNDTMRELEWRLSVDEDESHRV